MCYLTWGTGTSRIKLKIPNAWQRISMIATTAAILISFLEPAVIGTYVTNNHATNPTIAQMTNRWSIIILKERNRIHNPPDGQS